MQCCVCGATLTADEVALTKKLINRGAEQFMCINCLASHFNVTVALLQDKIEQFKEMGCTLFFKT